MTKLRYFLLMLCLWSSAAFSAHGQGTAFTYQGVLQQNGAPYSGASEMQFVLWTASSGGTALTTNPSTVVNVTNGLFTAAIAFGESAFSGADRWLEIHTRTAIGPFTVLTPRQKVTATPYALRAATATTATAFTGVIADSQLSGNIARLDSNLVFTGAVQFNNAGNNFSGSFTGNGGALTNVPVNSLTLTTTNSSVVAWGANGNNQSTLPAGLSNVIAVAVGGGHSLALAVH